MPVRRSVKSTSHRSAQHLPAAAPYTRRSPVIYLDVGSPPGTARRTSSPPAARRRRERADGANVEPASTLREDAEHQRARNRRNQEAHRERARQRYVVSCTFMTITCSTLDDTETSRRVFLAHAQLLAVVHKQREQAIV